MKDNMKKILFFILVSCQSFCFAGPDPLSISYKESTKYESLLCGTEKQFFNTKMRKFLVTEFHTGKHFNVLSSDRAKYWESYDFTLL